MESRLRVLLLIACALALGGCSMWPFHKKQRAEELPVEATSAEGPIAASTAGRSSARGAPSGTGADPGAIGRSRYLHDGQNSVPSATRLPHPGQSITAPPRAIP